MDREQQSSPTHIPPVWLYGWLGHQPLCGLLPPLPITESMACSGIQGSLCFLGGRLGGILEAPQTPTPAVNGSLAQGSQVSRCQMPPGTPAQAKSLNQPFPEKVGTQIPTPPGALAWGEPGSLGTQGSAAFPLDPSSARM